jgi:hypothetical protein
MALSLAAIAGGAVYSQEEEELLATPGEYIPTREESCQVATRPSTVLVTLPAICAWALITTIRRRTFRSPPAV